MADIETSVVISAQTDDLQSGMEAAANSVQAATEAMKAQFASLGAAAQQAQSQIGATVAQIGATIGTLQSKVASLASPGIDELRWLHPVRPGDVLRIRVSVLEATRSRSRPDRGMVRTLVEVLNQSGEIVMSLKPMNIIGCRGPA